MSDVTRPRLQARARLWLSYIYRQAAQSDWRARSVFFATVVAVLLTALVYIFAYEAATRASDHFGAVFASWVGGVALFVVGGSVVAIASLSRPEQEPFDARARILFRKRQGDHIDFIVARIPDAIEPYIEHAEKRIIVADYDEASDRFRCQIISKASFRGYIDDLDARCRSSVSYANAAPAPAGARSSSLKYLRVNGSPIGSGENFQDSLRREFDIVVRQGTPCRVEHELDVWVQAVDEANTHTPVRFTRALSVVIENHLPNQRIAVDINVGGARRRQDLAAGEIGTIINLTETRPRDKVYDFRLSVSGSTADVPQGA